MPPDNLLVGKKFIGKSVIAALASLPHVFGRYREARKSLRGSISRESRQGLDWMNFFLADVQTAFGAFVAFYLADLGWSKGQVGWHLRLERLLASSVRFLAARLSTQYGGSEAWRRLALPCCAYQR
jgi:hypothetical protein